MLAPHPSQLKLDPSRMSQGVTAAAEQEISRVADCSNARCAGEYDRARAHAALDDRVNRLLGLHGDDETAAPPLPPP
eukprot:COSAG06_NODE_57236_length_281_cov_0.659341_1_plen_76_part_10